MKIYHFVQHLKILAVKLKDYGIFRNATEPESKYLLSGDLSARNLYKTEV